MTTAANPRRDDLVATGGQTEFSYSFEVADEDDLVVEQNATVLTITTHYTVSGVGNENGGTVTLVTGATLDDEIAIYSDETIERTADYTTAGDFRATTVNAEMDKVFRLLRDNRDLLERTLRLDPSDPTTDDDVKLPLIASRASKYLAFGSDGALTVTSGTENAFVVSAFAETFLDDVDAESVRTTLGVWDASKTTVAVTAEPHEVTDVPAWAEKVTVVLKDVTWQGGSSECNMQLGHSSAYITTGYAGSYALIENGNTPGAGALSLHMVLAQSNAAGNALNGTVVLTRISSNIWAFDVHVSMVATLSDLVISTGWVDVTSALTKFKVYCPGGGDLDDGEVTYIYEGTQ